MTVTVVGVSHRTAPVEVRERFAFGPEEGREALVFLRKKAGLQEGVLLSTCNRTEIYLTAAPDGGVVRNVEGLLSHKAGSLDRSVDSYLFTRRGPKAVRHLFRVSAGLDSMVTGEAEIQGQVREAYDRAASVPVDPPITGPVLNRLFQMALSVGGEVRHETDVGTGTASVASVAVELARKVFGSLRDKRVMILGAGETGELTVKALGRAGVEGVMVVNRTYERAADLAAHLRGHAVPYDRMHEALAGTDIVVSSTAAPHHVLTRSTLQSVFPNGPRHPFLVMDLAIPRDVDPSLAEEPNVFLYNVDDLMRIVDEHVSVRRNAIPEANRIIDVRTEEFRNWYASLEAVPLIRSLRSRAEDIREEETRRLLQGLDHLEEKDRERIERFSRRLLNKLLHRPTVRLREGMADRNGRDLAEAVRFLYQLGGDEDEPGGAREPEERSSGGLSGHRESPATGGGSAGHDE